MIRSLPLIVLIALLLGYVATLGLGRASEFPASGVRYAFFASPKESVILLTNLAQKQDWQGFQSYVQRPDGHAPAAPLTSGSFRFSEPATPRQLTSGQTPDTTLDTTAKPHFPPHADYVSSGRKTNDQIHVTIRYPLTTDAENGNAGRTATGTYHLIYTPFGYQVLPD